MIIAERKPFEEVKQEVKDCKKLLILGCGTCVAVCMAGGEKEVGLLATELRMANKLAGKDVEIGEATIQRQCDREFIQPIVEKAKQYDAVLSLACGAGVQFVAEMMEPLPVLPGVNTRFIGVTQAEGMWAEKCLACGNCMLADYGGICPVTICAKGLLNGPCGGSNLGKCEASPEKDCAWELIYARLKNLGKLDNLRNFREVRDYRAHTSPGRVVNEAYQKAQPEATHSK
ncbi:MAG: methylenetetrahydrofolate reductase C-terminal domain-containing protein [Chloroflexi bacterium]|nr:methylenetetrahydrofolate reductase C-terminal domain-containing protein [Chloroflexota bacterium]